MTLLVDNQLPLALARYLAANGWECIHVRDVALEAATDRTIWQYALERGLTKIFRLSPIVKEASRPRWSGYGSAIVGKLHCWKRFRGSCLRCVMRWPPAMLSWRLDKIRG